MRKSSNGYYLNRHSCFLLQYHLVLVTKYRHPVITRDIEAFLKDYTMRYFTDRDLPILALETMPDHIHILFEASPGICLTELVNAFKTGSSRAVRENFAEELKPYYWKPYFWSLSYFIGSVSEQTTSVVKKYINAQKSAE